MKQNQRLVVAKGKDRRLLEVVIYRSKILILERNGQGQIEKLIKGLSGYGLSLEEEFNSPCG